MKRLLICLGVAICSYPLISSIISQYYLNDMIATYQRQVEVCDEPDIDEMLELAREYNQVLYQLEGKILEDSSDAALDTKNYCRMLNLAGNGIMGSIEIPVIGVKLPIYHGTSDEVLASGVGHIEGTSLPVGGESTRSVLSGHRGLPSSKLFTRLDELEIGDRFFIRMFDEMLSYEVADIEVIEPDDTEKLKIVPEKDLVTLLTCTPYGLNTHRLIVTGERVPYMEMEYEDMKEKRMSIRELLFGSIPFIFGIIGIGTAAGKTRIRNKGGKE